MSNNPAVQSLNRFGTMINKNILQPAAYALDHVNPVTLNRNITSAVQNAPDAMKKYDADYSRRVRTDLYGSSAPTTVLQPSTQAQYNNPMSPTKQPLAKVKAPGIESKPMPPVDVKKYDYSTGKPFSTSDLKQHSQDQQYAGDYGLSPYDNQHITPSNWRSPGARYNDLNKAELLTEDGLRAYDDVGNQTGVPYFDNSYMQQRYTGSHKPRTESERVAEGQEAHNRVLRGIAAYQNLNHYKRTGEDKPFPVYGGYDLSGPGAQQQQQQFENELAVKQHALAIQKRNDSLSPKQTPVNLQPQFTTEYDDNYNETGKSFAGSFNPRTGVYTPAAQSTIPPILDQPTFEALSQAKQMSKKSDKALSQYQQLLMELGLTLDWDADDE